jgi:hypothetical protein
MMEKCCETRTAVAVTKFDSFTVLGVADSALDRLPLLSPASRGSALPAGRRFPAQHGPARTIYALAAKLRERDAYGRRPARQNGRTQ